MSKIISFIAKLCGIMIAIAIPIVGVSMLIVGIVASKVEVYEESLQFTYKEDVLSLKENADSVEVMVNGKISKGSHK